MGKSRLPLLKYLLAGRRRFLTTRPTHKIVGKTKILLPPLTQYTIVTISAKIVYQNRKRRSLFFSICQKSGFLFFSALLVLKVLFMVCEYQNLVTVVLAVIGPVSIES